ncbi:hypothetical protein EDE12_106101 [Methylosinus sp. sav-2]|uniref:hypothetical protein n=1 Tax=unclassified Methylosinus TaxID=2624500 RepID=UPI00046641E2|nr:MULTISPECIES: hypothetical protein [unclassified Methylosinus]TDX63956.1 hypothetical protein EDE12_106101 [Methylosinus sp. sav-2]
MMQIAEMLAPSGLDPMPLAGVAPSKAHERTLASYLLNRHRGAAAVRDILIADIRGFVDLGQSRAAADLLVVLTMLLARWPETRRRAPRPLAWDATGPTPCDA